MWEAECQPWRAPVGPVEEAVEELMEHGDGVVLEVAPVIFDERMGGRRLDMAGQAVDCLELRLCQRPIVGHEFVSLILTHAGQLSLLSQYVRSMSTSCAVPVVCRRNYRD